MARTITRRKIVRSKSSKPKTRPSVKAAVPRKTKKAGSKRNRNSKPSTENRTMRQTTTQVAVKPSAKKRHKLSTRRPAATPKSKLGRSQAPRSTPKAPAPTKRRVYVLANKRVQRQSTLTPSVRTDIARPKSSGIDTQAHSTVQPKSPTSKRRRVYVLRPRNSGLVRHTSLDVTPREQPLLPEEASRSAATSLSQSGGAKRRRWVLVPRKRVVPESSDATETNVANDLAPDSSAKISSTKPPKSRHRYVLRKSIEGPPARETDSEKASEPESKPTRGVRVVAPPSVIEESAEQPEPELVELQAETEPEQPDEEQFDEQVQEPIEEPAQAEQSDEQLEQSPAGETPDEREEDASTVSETPEQSLLDTSDQQAPSDTQAASTTSPQTPYSEPQPSPAEEPSSADEKEPETADESDEDDFDDDLDDDEFLSSGKKKSSLGPLKKPVEDKPLSLAERAERVQKRLESQNTEIRQEYEDNLYMSWIYHDSALEGVVYSYKELQMAIDPTVTVVPESSMQSICDEIRRHKEAVDFVISSAQRGPKEQVTVDFIKQLYVLLHPEEGDVKSVKYRKDIPQHRMYFHDYAAPEKIASSIRQTIEWINDPDTKRTKTPIRIAARAHYDILQAFPFSKDSGKVARLLMNYLLLRAAYPPAIIHAAQRQAYYEALKGSPLALTRMVEEALENSIMSIEKFLNEKTSRVRSFIFS